MNLLDGRFRIQLQLIFDPSQLILDRIVFPLLERLAHRLIPELVRDEFEPIHPVDQWFSCDHLQTFPVTFLELSLQPTGRLFTHLGSGGIAAEESERDLTMLVKMGGRS